MHSYRWHLRNKVQPCHSFVQANRLIISYTTILTWSIWWMRPTLPSKKVTRITQIVWVIWPTSTAGRYVLEKQKGSTIYYVQICCQNNSFFVVAKMAKNQRWEIAVMLQAVIFSMHLIFTFYFWILGGWVVFSYVNYNYTVKLYIDFYCNGT